MRWVKAHRALAGYIWLAAAVLVALYLVGPVAEHRRCVDANQTNAAIRSGFATLGDKFIQVSGGSQQAIDFKNELLDELDLPQREC